jgi:hypothetical protein
MWVEFPSLQPLGVSLTLGIPKGVQGKQEERVRYTDEATSGDTSDWRVAWLSES